MDDDKVRVQFYAGDGVLPYELSKPIYIPVEDYVRIRMAEHRGDPTVLRDYIKNVLLKGTPVTIMKFSMGTAPGNPFHIMLVDQAIAEGKDPFGEPEDDTDLSSPKKKKEVDNTPTALDNYIIKYYPKWEEFSKNTRECIYIFAFVIICLLAACFLGMCSDDDKKSQGEKIEEVKDNASEVWGNIKKLGD